MVVRRAPTGSAVTNNPLHILQTLDRHLTKPAEITIFGRAALALGFPNSSATFATTHGVDAILLLAWSAAREAGWRERAADNRLVASLLTLKPKVRHGYSVVNAVIAQAGIVMVPELTILPKKRFWTGAITDSQVLATVEREHPEVLALLRGREDKDPAWQTLLERRYALLDSDGGLDLYVARELGVAKAEDSRELLHKLGL